MGVDKARLPIPYAGHARSGPWPMAVHVARVLGEVFDDVFVVRREDDGLPWPGVDVLWEDAEADTHPLFGLATCARHAPGETFFVAPCDVPGIDADIVRRLLDAGGVAKGQRLLGVFPTSVRARELALAGAPVRALFDTWNEVDVGPVTNVNVWADTGRPHPLDVLATLPGASARTLEGEVQRLAARGCVLPDRSG